jgi:hypothetical protein
MAVQAVSRAAPASQAERYVPIALLAAVMLVAAVVLPTALRPPPDEGATSPEFSPDAPPDDSEESLISQLGRGSTGTAGAGAGIGAESIGRGIPPEIPDAGTTKPAPPRKGKCYGEPARQTESLYSAPCVAAFKGDNGGKTYTGVSASEIRFGVLSCSDLEFPSYEGPIHEEPPDDPSKREDEDDRTYRVFQKYFNTRFEFYGRTLRFVAMRARGEGGEDDCVDTSTRAAMRNLADKYDVFGVLTGSPGAQHEAIRRKLVVGGGYQYAQEFYDRNTPYAHSWYIDGTKLLKLDHEFLCKQMPGPAQFAGDPTMNGDPRKFGALLFRSSAHDISPKHLQDSFRAECGKQWTDIKEFRSTSVDPAAYAADVANALVGFKNQEVTTVACFCDPVTAGVATYAATNSAYAPEWFMPGTGEMDNNFFAQFYDQAQWSHAIGVTAMEMARNYNEWDYYRAYKEIDPANDPDGGVGQYVFGQMLQIANGLQMAGPKLTPESFMTGLQRMPKRPPNNPIWAIAGGYSPGDYTYTDYVSMVWWDSNIQAPDTNTKGAYRHVNGGQRYTFNEIPTTQAGFFKEGMEKPPRTGQCTC